MESTENQTNKRREFLTKVCPTVAFAMFGISFLEACSSDSTSDPGTTGITDSESEAGNSDNNSTDSSGSDNSSNTPAYIIDGDTITADLSNAFFDNLKNVKKKQGVTFTPNKPPIGHKNLDFGQMMSMRTSNLSPMPERENRQFVIKK